MLTAFKSGELKRNNNTLKTYYRVETDGDGISSSGVVDNAANQLEGAYSFVLETAFLEAGVEITYVPTDATVEVTVTCRGRNPEDFGALSDLTEAPEIGSYSAQLRLDITY